MLRVLLIGAFIAVWQQSAFAQPTKPTDDAAALYQRAAAVLMQARADGIMSPSNSILIYKEYPPYPPEWCRMQKSDYSANAEARALAHEARSIDQANWPPLAPLNLSESHLTYFNDCRALTNDLADAAIYQHVQGDDAAAIATLRDLSHIADMVQQMSTNQFSSLLVSDGIRAVHAWKLQIIISNVALTRDRTETKSLQVTAAQELIRQLLKNESAKSQVDEALRGEGAEAKRFTSAQIDRCTEQLKRTNTDRDLAAMSIACQLCRFDTGAWPKTLEDLHGYIPDIPLDPWGDGKQTLGYALIKGGLPDGSDRPLVYSRDRLKDGLFFRTDEPAYSFYFNDGSDRPAREQKQGGQFRDVTSWVPPAGKRPAEPTTEPLQ